MDREYIDAYLRTVTCKITQHATVEEAEVRALLTYVGPLRTSEPSDSGPVVSLKFLHPVEKDIE